MAERKGRERESSGRLALCKPARAIPNTCFPPVLGIITKHRARTPPDPTPPDMTQGEKKKEKKKRRKSPVGQLGPCHLT